jgi:hypothetical protein
VTEPEQLRWELGLLKQEFPDAKLYEVRLEYRLGERTDHPGLTQIEREWSDTSWTIQVGNERESAASVAQAFAALREALARKAQVPAFAERVAAVLRDVPDAAFEREIVVMAAREILEKERGRR